MALAEWSNASLVNIGEPLVNSSLSAAIYQSWIPDIHEKFNGTTYFQMPTISTVATQPVFVRPPKKPWPLLRQPVWLMTLLCIANGVVFLLGVVNNSLVLAVIYKNPRMRTVTNYFLANLAVADLLVTLLVLPMTLISNIFTEWWYGPFLCKAVPYLQGVSVSASVNTLAAVAIERYLAIFFPQTTKLTTRNAALMICLIWIVPICIFIPWMVVYEQVSVIHQGYTYKHCSSTWSEPHMQRMFVLFAVFLTCYLLPLIFIAVFYLLIGVRVWKRNVRGMRGTLAERNIHKSKVRIIRMLVAVFVIFALFWLPLYIVKLRVLFKPNLPKWEILLLQQYIAPFAQWLGAANSCVNPFVYCYYSLVFRKNISDLLRLSSCRPST